MAQVKTAGWHSTSSHAIKPKTCKTNTTILQQSALESTRKTFKEETEFKNYLNRRDPTSTKEQFRFWFSSAGCKASCSAEFTGEMPTSHLRSSAFRSKDNSHSIWSWGTRLLPDFQAQASTIQVSISHPNLERFWKRCSRTINLQAHLSMQRLPFSFNKLHAREGLVTNSIVEEQNKNFHWLRLAGFPTHLTTHCPGRGPRSEFCSGDLPRKWFTRSCAILVIGKEHTGILTQNVREITVYFQVFHVIILLY